jgi:hypothetical protein
MLPKIYSEVIDEFDLSASDILIAASLSIFFAVLSENEVKQ